MKLILFVTFFNIVILLSCSQVPQKDKELDKAFVIGEVTWEEWKSKAGWDIYEAYDYKPNEEGIKTFARLLKGRDYKFVIFATTYCEDCKYNLPIIFEIFKSAGVENNKIRLFGLDENLMEPSGNFEHYKVKTTPVVYLEVNNKVIGEAGFPYYWLDIFIEILENHDGN